MFITKKVNFYNCIKYAIQYKAEIKIFVQNINTLQLRAIV